MKTVVAFSFLIVGIVALPPAETDDYSINLSVQRDLVTGAIVNAIQGASQSIRDAGLDPLYIERKEYKYALPVPTIFNAAAILEEVMSTGLSNIVIHKMNYAAVQSRLTFDIELPLIHFSLESGSAEATLFSNKFDLKTSGEVNVRGIRVSGQIRVSVGIISGISIRNLSVVFALGGIDSDIKLVIQEKDQSEKINTFLNKTVPDTLKQYNAEINELLEILLLKVINDNLNKF